MESRLTTEKKITLVSVPLAVLLLGVAFEVWMLKNNVDVLAVSFWLALFSLVLFLFAFAFALKNFSRDLTRPLACEKTGEKRSTIKTFLTVTGAMGVWAFLLFIICGFLKTAGNTANFWQQLESLMKSLDSQHYLFLAENWYTNNGNLATDVLLVFFPGYPILIRILGSILGNYFVASEIISMACYALAGGFTYLIAEDMWDDEAGIFSVVFLAVFPGSFFFVTPMSESLFLMLTLGSVYFIRKKKWLPAALMGCYSAFTRSAGIFVAIVFVYELALDFWQGKHTKKRLANSLLRLLYVLIIPVGLVAYLLINKSVSGDAFKFLYYQKTHWNQSLGFFFSSVHYMTEYFGKYIKDGNTTTAIGLWLMGLLAIFTTVITLALRGKKLRTSYLLYSLVYFAFSMGATWLLSAPRYAVGMFTLPLMLGGMTKNKTVKFAAAFLLLLVNVVYVYMFTQRWQVW